MLRFYQAFSVELPIAAFLALVLIVLLTTGMQIDNNVVCCVIMVLGYLLATGQPGKKERTALYILGASCLL